MHKWQYDDVYYEFEEAGAFDPPFLLDDEELDYYADALARGNI